MKALKDLISRTQSASKQLRTGLSEAREQIEALKAKKAETEALPPTMEVITRRAEEFADRVAHSVRSQYPDPERFIAGHYEPPQYYDPSETMGYYLRHILADAIVNECEEALEGRETISEQERGSRLAKIDADILAAELAEEAVIRMAEAGGFPVERRIDADPRAVLARDEDLPQ